MMDRQPGHMVRLIDDLMDVSRISRGKVELKRERVELRNVIEHALVTSRPLIDAGHNSVTVQLPESPIWLDVDLTRLAQVVSNLLTNAAKYTPDKGTIRLVAGQEGSENVIAITDSGVGIPQAMLSQVFEMFTQVNKTLDRSQGASASGCLSSNASWNYTAVRFMPRVRASVREARLVCVCPCPTALLMMSSLQSRRRIQKWPAVAFWSWMTTPMERKPWQCC
ncbi:hypothetical protein BH11PLA2_BH11PLA2_19590 [soil metagenome]